ncbi:MAG: TAXI family TRAP transporter solute-binding subunit [Desulfurococcales archaeon]|nr:TAXI family TRAP transporter solute-binding subunit [Desulfurococcales archaeon]
MARHRKASSGGSNTMMIAIGVIVILVIVAAAFMFMGGGEEATTTQTTQAQQTQTQQQTAQQTQAQQEEKFRIIMYTGSPGGIYNPLGKRIAEVVSKYSDKLEVVAQDSGASVANGKAIKIGDAQVALMQSDVAYFAYNGKLIKDFEGNPVENLRALASLYPEPIQIAARADAGVKTIWDLEGKVVAVGNPGSGLYATAYTILSTLGLWDKIVKQELGFKDVSQQIKQGTVDVFFVVAGVPTPKIEQLAIQVKLNLVSVPDDAIQKLKEAGLGSLYLPYKIPAGSYEFQTEEIQTVTVMATLVASADLPDDVVYEFLKTMFEHLDEIKTVHERAKDIDIKKAPTTPIPLHPGAEKFYKDQGVLS